MMTSAPGATWHDTCNRGRPRIYSDLAIQCCLTLKALFKQPLRVIQGYVCSLMHLLLSPLSLPDYSLLSIFQKILVSHLPKASKISGKIHLVIDLTGLKLFGEGK